MKARINDKGWLVINCEDYTECIALSNWYIQNPIYLDDNVKLDLNFSFNKAIEKKKLLYKE